MRFLDTVGGLLSGLLVFVPSFALAQDTTDEAPKVQQIKAVERGFYVQTDVGFTIPVTKLLNRRFGVSPNFGVYLGYDILDILNVSLGLSVLATPAGPNEDFRDRTDLLLLSPQVQVQFAVLTTERNFLWVQVHGGVGIGSPSKLGIGDNKVDFGTISPIFGAMVGFERFTKLRHFSIGIRAGIDLMPGVVKKADGVEGSTFGLAVSIIPTVKYTF